MNGFDMSSRTRTCNGDYFALWSGKSECPDPWFDWFEGNIYTKNPDDPLIDKAVEIAKNLDARVQGDDGEIYIGGGSKNFLPPLEPDAPSTTPPPRRSWFRRLLGGERWPAASRAAACPAGYDLRSTPGGCSECGTAPVSTPGA